MANKEFNNVTISVMFENEKFGEGAFKSMPVDAKAFDALQEVQIGSSFVLKPGKRKDGTPVTSKEGSVMYFLEVLPPFEKGKTGAKTTKGRANASEDI